MPPPNIHSEPPAPIAAELANLSAALTDQIPKKRGGQSRNLLIATWNIRAFGSLTGKWISGANDSPKRELGSLVLPAAGHTLA